MEYVFIQTQLMGHKHKNTTHEVNNLRLSRQEELSIKYHQISHIAQT